MTTLIHRVVVVLALMGSSAVEIFANSAIEPVGSVGKEWTRETREERHEKKVKEAEEGDPDLVMIGDSSTHHWERTGNAQTYLDKSLPDVEILNLGFGGDRTQNVLWRLQNGEILRLSPPE